MDINNKYELAFEKIDEVIEKRNNEEIMPAMGYTSNLDLICNFKIENLNTLLSKYLPNIDLSKLKAAEKIYSMIDLLETIVYFCSHGIGGEVDIENEELLQDNFEWEYGIGGTAVQAAMALAGVNCPSIVHLTDDSSEVCKLLNNQSIYTVSQTGKLIHTAKVESVSEQEIHFIIQFKKGDIIKLADKEIIIPVSNRLIITKITVNERLPFADHYFKYIENNAAQISSNVLSSFNALLDSDLLLKRITYLKKHLKKYKSLNRSGIVFFEDAHYHNQKIKKICMENIYPEVDLLSLNEEELKSTLNFYNYPLIMDDIISVIRGMDFIREKFKLKKGVIVHSKDYSMYSGSELKADLANGLIYGNLLATTKAINGWYGNKQQIAETLKLKLSPEGIKAKKIVESSKEADHVIIVPTKYIDKPKYTIGLGDSFVAGVQICF